MKKLLLTCFVLLQAVCSVWAQDLIRSVSLPDHITVGVGETIDLTQYVTISPEGATLPSYAEWDYAKFTTWIKIENNQLTGLAAWRGIQLTLRIPYDTHVLEAETYVDVVEVPPTAINIKGDYQSVTVNVGETAILTDFLSKAYEFEPSYAIANVRWSADDETIVQYNSYWNDQQQFVEEYQPLKAGTTTLTAQIYDVTGGVSLSSSQNVIVKVLQPVTDVINNSGHNQEECNVGDDLTSYLNSLLQVLPADASDKSVKWSILRDGDAVSISDDGKIMAVKPGSVILEAASVSNPNATGLVTVLVHNPATDIHFTSETVDVEYISEPVDISQKLKDNISFLPSGYESVDGFTVTSDRPNDVVTIDEYSINQKTNELTVKARAVGVGKATITVGIDYRDYLADYTNPATTEHRTKVTKTFTVNVTQGDIPVKSISNTSNRDQEECNVGDDLTSYLNSLITVLPENADDKTFKWSVPAGTAGDVISIGADGVIKALKAGSVTLVATSNNNRNATASVKVLVHNPATDIRFSSETVGAVYTTESVDISQKLEDNISFLPSGYESVDGFTVTSDRPNDVVTIDEYSINQKTNELTVKARAVGVGKATITVSIDYRDYLADYTNPATTEHRTKVTKTFTVNVTQGDIPVKSISNTSNRDQEECNVGDDLTSYLNSLITVLPENADDKTFKWSVPAGTAGDVISIGADGVIKALKAGSVTLVATSNNNRNATASVKVLVHNPATDIRFSSETVGAVYTTESVDISQKLKDNISFFPSGYESVDGFTVTSDRPNDVVTIDEYSINQKTNELTVKARAVGVGKATITVSIDYRDYLADYTNPSTTEHRTKVTKSFVVDVTQGDIPVKSLHNTSSRDLEECNVGDNLTSYLKSLIQILPDDASDQSLKWSVVRGDAVTVSGDGTIMAAKAGTAVVQTASVDNPDATATVTVLVHNPATDIRFASEIVSVVYVTEDIDINQKIKENISFLPSDFESLEGLTITSDSPNDVVIVDEYSYNEKTNELSVKARALGVGKATITVSIDYRDYLADYTSPAAAGHRTKVTKSFVVNVTQGEIPVKSLTNMSNHNIEECNVGDDLTSYLNSLITVLPENADDKTFKWSVAVGNVVEAVSVGDDGVVKAIKAGSVTLVATSNNNPEATATVSVQVHNPATDIQFVNSTLYLEYNGRESDVSQKLKDNISFLPSDFESIEGLSIVSDRPNDIVAVEGASYSQDVNELIMKARVLGAGEATITVSIDYRDYLSDYTNPATTGHHITVTKSFNVEVTEVIPVISSVMYPDELTISRYHDVMLQLTVEPDNAILDPALIEIRFGESKNDGWGPAAVATPSVASGSVWNLRGRFTGDYPYQVYYDGQPQPTTNGGRQGIIHIPAEYPLAQGWDWVSLYATDKSGSLPLRTPTGWIAPLQIDENNYVQEIRSQHELLYKDPETGFFGDIEQLSPSDGMYKVNSYYDASIANQMILSAGYEGLVSSSEQRLPLARKGYTWITYPHELNHSLEVLAPYLLQSAEKGDMVIGRDMFVVYNGSEWLGADDCVFEAGKGYIYYTESETPKTINWGPVTLIPDPEAPKTAHTRGEQASATPWTYNPYANPDCMAVIAQIKGLDNPQDYLVGAFVGNECRGQGTASTDGLFLVPVSGQSGDLVSFQLYHKPSRNYQMISGQYRFASHMGSVSSPLILRSTTTAISTVGDGMLSINVSNDVIMVSGAVGETELEVTDMQGKCVATCRGATLSITSLPSGIYIVRASNGSRQVIKKIKK